MITEPAVHLHTGDTMTDEQIRRVAWFLYGLASGMMLAGLTLGAFW